jgi:hypothetical protein
MVKKPESQQRTPADGFYARPGGGITKSNNTPGKDSYWIVTLVLIRVELGVTTPNV